MFKKYVMAIACLGLLFCSGLHAKDHEKSEKRECQHCHCKKLKAKKAKIKKLKAKEAEIDKLKAKEAEIDQLNGKDATFDGTVTFKSNVIDKVGGIYVVRKDIPTIQAGIDLVSSGLKPDSNVIISIPPGIYPEALVIDTSTSDPTFDDPRSDILLKPRGLRLEGDLRPIAAMTYMDGGFCESDSGFFQNSGLNSLGTLDALVALNLSNGGKTITVTLSSPVMPVIQPNFNNCQVLPGDTVIVYDNTGLNFQEVTVESVSLNSITVNTPVTIRSLGAGLNKGSALTFCPRVQVSAPAELNLPQCYIRSGQVEIIGVWFKPPSRTVNNFQSVIVEDGILWTSQLLADNRFIRGDALEVLIARGEIKSNIGDGDVAGHVTVMGGDLGGAGIGEFLNIYLLLPGNNNKVVELRSYSNRLFSCSSLQINGGKNAAFGIQNQFGPVDIFVPFVLSVFNCQTGISLRPNSTITTGSQAIGTVIEGVLLIDNCTTGIDAVGNFIFNQGTGMFQGVNSLISNCTTGINLTAGSIYSTQGSLAFQNCNTAIKATVGSAFSVGGNVTFTSVTNPYVIDDSSQYLTPNNAGTDITPNNVFTYSTSGTHVMNSAYLNQLIDSTGIVNLTLDPSLTISGIQVYQGKIFTLTSVSTGSHTLTLQGGFTFLDGTTTKHFNGVGASLTIDVIKVNGVPKVAILSSLGVT